MKLLSEQQGTLGKREGTVGNRGEPLENRCETVWETVGNPFINFAHNEAPEKRKSHFESVQCDLLPNHIPGPGIRDREYSKAKLLQS